MKPASKIIFLILCLTLSASIIPAVSVQAQPGPSVFVQAPQSQRIRISGGPFDTILQWFRDRAAEFKQTIARWKSIDFGGAIARGIENMFSGVSNLGKGIQKQLEKGLPNQ